MANLEEHPRAARVLRHAVPLRIAAVALVALTGVATILIAVRLVEIAREINQTFDSVAVAQGVFSTLQDAETGQRGFVLTSEERYLEPFSRARETLPGLLSQLRTFAGDDAEQAARVTRLTPLVTAKFEELQRTIDETRAGRRTSALALVRSGEGLRIMDDIRVELGAFIDQERESLQAHQGAAITLRIWLIGLVAFSLIASLIISSLLIRAQARALADLRVRTRELESEKRQREAAEDSLRQVQKMEAVGQLAGGVAHDFNNLLTVVIGNLDTLARRITGAPTIQADAALTESLTRPIQSAQQGARGAAQLTQRLLAFSRRQTLAPVRLDINRLVSGMSDLITRSIGEAINVETVLAGGLWNTLCDANQLENALLNLAINARDAMPDGGQLTIETANVYLDEAYAARFGDVTAGQYVALSVTDTGQGIPPDVLQRVFEPFFTTKPTGEGTGLGLAMVHGFVKQTGGHVRIYSEAGAGTTVRLYLPRLAGDEGAHAAPAGREEANAPPPRAKDGEAILVVEDDPGVRDYAKTTLEELGYRVLAAGDGAEALTLLDTAQHIDLLFTDVMLPGGYDGRRLAAEVEKRKPGLPVLFTTGYTRNSIVHNGRLDANVQLLNKPYSMSALARKVRDVLGN